VLARRHDNSAPAFRPAVSAVALVCLALTAATPARADTGLPADWQRGANFTSWWHDTYETPEAARRLDALRATGTTHVSLLTTWYMNTRESSQVQSDPTKTPSDQGLAALTARARQLGMRVAIKPHVDVRDGTFRGDIAPQDVEAWFASYRTMLAHYADLARAAGADMLVVGTELTSVSVHTDRWRSLIADVRARFGGLLTFAANWTDGARRIAFWPDLDYIGIDAYMPLVGTEPNPSVEQLERAFCATTTSLAGSRRYVAETQALHQRFGRPILLTEAGYRSQLGTASKPWDDTGGAPSWPAQQNAYEAAYRIWSRVPWIKGLYWWDWRASGDGGGDTSYTPAGKPAETTMREWNGATAPAPTADPCATPRPARPRLTLRWKRKLFGTLRQGRSGCAQPVLVRVERRARRAWRRGLRLKVRPRASGRFRVSRPLRAGRYRARATASGRPCGAVKSRYVRFRVRVR
jgi:hypothetical protein